MKALTIDDRPLAIDLFTGLHGWAQGLAEEGYRVVGFDIEDMCGQFGQRRPDHVQLVIQDVLTLHGSQFKDAALIVASPPCQGYSYRAMPWKCAKALPPPDNTLFEACFRIQREASEASGRHIPLIVENVRGAQPWVGRARWNFGSFYLWGDVPALMPITVKAAKVPGFRFDGSGKSFQSASVEATGYKTVGMNWSDRSKTGQDFTRIAGQQAMDGRKAAKDSLGGYGGNFGWDDSPMRRGNSRSPARKMASAMIAKIPLRLSRHIGATYFPK